MVTIRSIHDLESEIARLKQAEAEQKTALGKRFDSPGAVFQTVMSLFPKNAAAGNVGQLISQDYVGLISRLVLPFALNKTLFRKSNFIVKALVGLVSQKASHFISEDSVGKVWHSITALFHKKDKKNKSKDLRNYGIPPM